MILFSRIYANKLFLVFIIHTKIQVYFTTNTDLVRLSEIGNYPNMD